MADFMLFPFSDFLSDSGSLQDAQNGQSTLNNCQVQGKHCRDNYAVHIWDTTENERIQKARDGLLKDHPNNCTLKKRSLRVREGDCPGHRQPGPLLSTH